MFFPPSSSPIPFSPPLTPPPLCLFTLSPSPSLPSPSPFLLPLPPHFPLTFPLPVHLTFSASCSPLLSPPLLSLTPSTPHPSPSLSYSYQPENILISGVELKPTIKLIDFGSAQELNEDVVLVASSSPEFSAPEIISQEGARLVSDMWSVGVLTYIL